jgi:hypothetical protein
VVRRPPAVLVAYAATFAYLLVTPVLPDVGGTGDANTLISDIPTVLLLGACVLVWLPARDDAFALALLALGAGLIAAGATEGGSIPVADVTKALFAASLGMLLAWALAEPAILVAVPLFVAGIDVASVAGGPSELLARDDSRAGEFLSLYLPAWGGGRAGVLGLADLLFLAFFAAGAWRFGLRRRVTTAALLLALPATVAIQLAVDVTVPVLPVLAAALLVPNLDLLPGLLAGERPAQPG